MRCRQGGLGIPNCSLAIHTMLLDLIPIGVVSLVVLFLYHLRHNLNHRIVVVMNLLNLVRSNNILRVDLRRTVTIQGVICTEAHLTCLVASTHPFHWMVNAFSSSTGRIPFNHPVLRLPRHLLGSDIPPSIWIIGKVLHFSASIHELYFSGICINRIAIVMTALVGGVGMLRVLEWRHRFIMDLVLAHPQLCYDRLIEI